MLVLRRVEMKLDGQDFADNRYVLPLELYGLQVVLCTGSNPFLYLQRN